MLQVQDQSLRPLTTAHLAQTMSLLVLPNHELRDKVLAELASNPALELLDEHVCPGCHRTLRSREPCPICSRRKENGDPIVFLSPRESLRPVYRGSQEDLPSAREPAAPENLPTYVLQQLAADLLPEERKLAIYILSSLDENGFLTDPPAYIAQATRSNISRVHHVLDLISGVDPIGLATEGPRHALLIQLGQTKDEGSLPKIAKRILEEMFSELARREYDKIAETLGITSSIVKEAAAFIHDNLNPYPARSYWGSGRQPQQGDPNVYHAPDIMVTLNPADETGPLIVEIFSPLTGWLRVNPLFRQAFNQTNGDHSEEWSKHLERANLFVKCLQQRNNTMVRLMELLVTTQREFILQGGLYLKSMTRAMVAKEIGVHESTISRAVAHKSVALPDGRIIPISQFFDRSLSVRDQIKGIIEKEIKPLTDDQIAAQLKREGVKIARRTVAKYRAIEGILPARLRQGKKIAHAARA